VKVELRPVTDEDWRAIAEVLRDPTVAPWWGVTRDDVREDFEDPHAILVDGELAGVVDLWEENEPGYRHAGLDIVLGAPVQDRGIGREALRLAARILFDERGHHRITIDPAAHNVRAIRCYEAVGFRRVGVLRQYEQGLDGSWHDGLLMDLLRDELR
jgi:aminoglycoside 6'-N-acetyltransferase